MERLTCNRTAGATQDRVPEELANRRGAKEEIWGEICRGGNRSLVVYNVVSRQNICLPQVCGCKYRQEDKLNPWVERIGCVNAVGYNFRQVSRTCLCGHNIAARATCWTVTGQLGFHRKAKRQEAQAKGKRSTPEAPRCWNHCHRISLPYRLTDHTPFRRWPRRSL
jgi:hypothetical protein